MEKLLRRCLDSLVVSDSLMDHLEILVINDGSKDGSSAIAHEFEDKYPGVFKVIDKENGNYGSCINRGLKEATGMYFRTLDSDDYYNTPAFESFLHELMTFQADLVVSEYVINFNDRQECRIIPENIVDKQVYKACDFDIKKSGCDRLFDIHSMTYKTSLLKEIGLQLQHGISYTDTEYCYFPFRFVKDIVFSRNRVYEYSMDLPTQTVSVSSRIKSLNAMLLISNRILDDFKANGLEKMGLVGDNCRTFSTSVVDYFYQTILLYCKKTDSLDDSLKKMDEKLKVCDSYLYDSLESISLNHIPYIKIWRRYGLYNTNFIFSTLNKIYELKDTLKHKVFKK